MLVTLDRREVAAKLVLRLEREEREGRERQAG
jgi:hypothetical protein